MMLEEKICGIGMGHNKTARDYASLTLHAESSFQFELGVFRLCCIFVRPNHPRHFGFSTSLTDFVSLKSSHNRERQLVVANPHRLCKTFFFGGFGLCQLPPSLCDIPSGCCFFTVPWTVTRSSLRMLRRVAAFCRPLRPVLLLVSFPRSRSPVVGVPALCWMWQDVPFAR